MESESPRRNRIDKLTPSELAIWNAMQAVEAMPADVRLTEAGNLLKDALEKVADFVDGVPPVTQAPTEADSAPKAE
jgi:hypothetical protein